MRNARPLSRRSRQKLKSDAAQILDQSRSVKIVTRESKTVPLPPISMKSTAKVQVRIDFKILPLRLDEKNSSEIFQLKGDTLG